MLGKSFPDKCGAIILDCDGTLWPYCITTEFLRFQGHVISRQNAEANPHFITPEDGFHDVWAKFSRRGLSGEDIFLQSMLHMDQGKPIYREDMEKFGASFKDYHPGVENCIDDLKDGVPVYLLSCVPVEILQHTSIGEKVAGIIASEFEFDSSGRISGAHRIMTSKGKVTALRELIKKMPGTKFCVVGDDKSDGKLFLENWRHGGTSIGITTGMTSDGPQHKSRQPHLEAMHLAGAHLHEADYRPGTPLYRAIYSSLQETVPHARISRTLYFPPYGRNSGTAAPRLSLQGI